MLSTFATQSKNYVNIYRVRKLITGFSRKTNQEVLVDR